jgi:hypothetical protein
MPLYTASELRERKQSGNPFGRMLQLKDNDEPTTIWIPSPSSLYVRKHFGVKTFSSFKGARYDTIYCFNQNLGQKGKGCPICEEVESLWKKWHLLKEAGKKDEMKKVQEQLNRFKGVDYYYFNAINLDDPEHKFFALCLTAALSDEIIKKDEKYSLENITWLLQKVNVNGNKRTNLTPVTKGNEAIVKELQAKLEEYNSRDFEAGGPVDLEKAYDRKYTKAEYADLIGSSDEAVDDPADKLPEDNEMVVEEESIQLDELEPMESVKEAPKAKESVKETKQEKPKEKPAETDEISIDDLELENDLEPLDFDDEPKELIKITAKEINEKRAVKQFIGNLYSFLLSSNKVAQKTDYKDKLMEVFNFAKKGDIEIPKNELDAIPF